jgi:tetratricopeptide (TPR) repeat protein
MLTDAARFEDRSVDRLVDQETTRYLVGEPRVAALLSALVMGLGQLFNAQYKRAFVFFGGEVAVFLYLWDYASGLYVSQTLVGLSSPLVYKAFLWVLSLGGLALWAYNIVDAFKMALFCQFIYDRAFPLLDDDESELVARHLTIHRGGLSYHRGLSRKAVFLGGGIVVYSAALIGLSAFYLGQRDRAVLPAVAPAATAHAPAPKPLQARVDATDPKARLKFGEARFDAGDLAGAELEFQAVLAMEPSPRLKYQALVDLGRLASARGDDARASEMLLQAVSVSKVLAAPAPPKKDSPLARADAALREGDAVKAEELLTPVAGDSRSWLLLARTAASRNDWERARRFLSAYVAAPASSVEAYLELARAESHVGRRSEALAHAERYLRHRPGHVEATLLRAELLEAEKGAAAAFQAIEEALAVHPRDPRLLAESMQLAEYVGNTDQALQAARALLKVDPNNARAKVIIKAGPAVPPEPPASQAAATPEAPEPELASKLYGDRATAGHTTAATAQTPLEPAEVPVDRYADLLREAEMAFASGDKKKALLLYDKVLAIRPDHPRSLQQKGVILRQGKDRASALQALEAAHKARPQDPATLTELAQLYQELDKRTQAKETFRALLAVQPKNLAARYSLAELLERDNDLTSAEEQYRSIQQHYPELADSYDYLGNLMYRTGKYPEAIEQFQQLLALNGNDPTVRFKIGLLYYRMSRPQRALEHFRAVAAQMSPESELYPQVQRYLAKLEAGERRASADSE